MASVTAIWRLRLHGLFLVATGAVAVGLLLFLNFLPLLAVDGIAAADTEPLAKGGFYAQLYNSQFESGDEMGN